MSQEGSGRSRATCATLLRWATERWPRAWQEQRGENPLSDSILSPRGEYYATSPAPQAPAVASRSIFVVTRLLPQDAVVGPSAAAARFAIFRGAANARRT